MNKLFYFRISFELKYFQSNKDNSLELLEFKHTNVINTGTE